MENSNYGLLINKDAKLHRKYFSEMCKLLGIQVIYQRLKPGCKWTTYGEIQANYEAPLSVFCIYQDYPDQRTMKKLGWATELDDQAAVIIVPYDLPDIQVGCLFTIPSAVNPKEGRLFRVTELATAAIYPASVACKIVPEYYDNIDPTLLTHKTNSFSMLREEGDGSL